MTSMELPEVNAIHINEESVYMLEILPWEDVIFRHIFSCLKLRHLFKFRASCHMCHRCVTEYFFKMKSLVLNNMGSKFSGDTFKIITQGNSMLRQIIIRNSSDWVNDDIVLPVFENSAKLVHVDLSQNTTITNKTLQRVVVTCGPTLQTLILRECHWLSTMMLNQVAMNCPELKKLDITGCWEIQDKAITNISMLCKKMQHLSVAKIYGLTDQSICDVARNLHELNSLNVQGCWRITDQSVFLLAEYCKLLKLLHVRDCRDVSMACLEKVKAKGIKVDLLSGKKKKVTPAYYAFMKGLPM